MTEPHKKPLLLIGHRDNLLLLKVEKTEIECDEATTSGLIENIYAAFGKQYLLDAMKMAEDVLQIEDTIEEDIIAEEIEPI